MIFSGFDDAVVSSSLICILVTSVALGEEDDIVV